MKRVQLIRDTTAGLTILSPGLVGELWIDLTKKTIVLQDAVTSYGIAMAREDLANVAAVTIAADGKMTAADKIKLNTLPSPTALTYLRGNAGATAYELLSLAAVWADLDTLRNTVNYGVFAR